MLKGEAYSTAVDVFSFAITTIECACLNKKHVRKQFSSKGRYAMVKGKYCESLANCYCCELSVHDTSYGVNRLASKSTSSYSDEPDKSNEVDL